MSFGYEMILLGYDDEQVDEILSCLRDFSKVNENKLKNRLKRQMLFSEKSANEIINCWNTFKFEKILESEDEDEDTNKEFEKTRSEILSETETGEELVKILERSGVDVPTHRSEFVKRFFFDKYFREDMRERVIKFRRNRWDAWITPSKKSIDDFWTFKERQIWGISCSSEYDFENTTHWECPQVKLRRPHIVRVRWMEKKLVERGGIDFMDEFFDLY